MRTHAAEEDLDDEESFSFHSDHFDIRHQSRRNRVSDQAGQPFLFIQGIFDTNDLAVIGHPEDQTSSG